MMRAFVVSLLASMASGLVVTQRPAVTQRRGAVKMIYGARNPTGPFAGNPVRVQWRIDAASESVGAVPAHVSKLSSSGRGSIFLNKRYYEMPYYVVNTEEHKLSSANLYYDAPMIEQVQCKIKTRSNGDTGLLGIGGISPTLVRSVRDGQWGEWDLVYKGQNRWLFSGDQISLDYNNPEAALFQLTEEVHGMTWEQWWQMGGMTGGMQDGGVWEAQVDPTSGQTYYLNSQTGEYQWEPPQGF